MKMKFSMLLFALVMLACLFALPVMFNSDSGDVPAGIVQTDYDVPEVFAETGTVQCENIITDCVQYQSDQRGVVSEESATNYIGAVMEQCAQGGAGLSCCDIVIDNNDNRSMNITITVAGFPA